MHTRIAKWEECGTDVAKGIHKHRETRNDEIGGERILDQA